jgi:hypothetical protein
MTDGRRLRSSSEAPGSLREIRLSVKQKLRKVKIWRVLRLRPLSFEDLDRLSPK